MKRHPSLQDLSREHHRILLHARELRWASRGKGDLMKACRDVLDYWKNRGEAHFKQEEEKLYPYCERCRDWTMTEAVDLVFKQHEEIQSLLAELEARIESGEDLKLLASALGELLDKHIRHEERVVFEQIQDILTEDEMERLRAHLDSPDGSALARSAQ